MKKPQILNSGTVRSGQLNLMLLRKQTNSGGVSGSSIILFYEEQ